MTYYVAKTKGEKKELKLTNEELEVGTKPIEINIELALKRMKDEYDEGQYNSSLRDIIVFNELNKS